MPDGDYNPVSPQKYCLFLIKKNFSQIISGILRRQASDKNNRLVLRLVLVGPFRLCCGHSFLVVTVGIRYGKHYPTVILRLSIGYPTVLLAALLIDS